MIIPLLLVLFNQNSGLYNINRKIVNDASRVIRMTIVTDAPGCGITYDCHSDNSEVSFMLLASIYSTGITHDDHHLRSSYFYSTGHRFLSICVMSPKVAKDNCNKFYFIYSFKIQIWVQIYWIFERDQTPIHYLSNKLNLNTDKLNIFKCDWIQTNIHKRVKNLL